MNYWRSKERLWLEARKEIGLMKKVLLASVLCLILMLIVKTPTFAGSSTDFLWGTGTSEDPYLISNKQHLDNMRNYLDAHFQLAADIAFTESDFSSAGSYYNNGNCWLPIGSSAEPFTGAFDGNGHTISGLVMKATDYSYAGLFAYSTGTICSLTLEDCSFDSAATIGGIAGYNSGTVSGCMVIDSVLNSSESCGGIVGENTGEISDCGAARCEVSATRYAGGICGKSGKKTIQRCYNSSSVNSGSYAGGIAGHVTDDAGLIKDCYNAGIVTAPEYAAGIVWRFGWPGLVTSTPGNLINCYNVGFIISDSPCPLYYSTHYSPLNCYYLKNTASFEAYKLQEISINEIGMAQTYQGFDFENVWEMSSDTQYGCPVLKSVEHIDAVKTVSDDFESGCGMPYSPYIITSIYQLECIRDHSNAWFMLANDLTFAQEDFVEGGKYYNNGSFWQPISFTDCVFDGNGNTISGLRVKNNDYAGLFGEITGAVHNLQIEDATINGSSYVGAIAGKCTGVISNSSVKNSSVRAENATVSTTAYDTYVGGIVGYMSGSAIGCQNSAEVVAVNSYRGYGSVSSSYYMYAGGIAGVVLNSTCSNCYNSGDIKSISYKYSNGSVGGICGEGRCKTCCNTGSVTNSQSGSQSKNKGRFAGGITGAGSVEESCNWGDVEGPYAGGIVGNGDAQISNCYNTGTVDGSLNSNDGGIASSLNGGYTSYIKSCYYVDSSGIHFIYGGENFDYDKVWAYDVFTGYPYPQLQKQLKTPASIEIITVSEECGFTLEGLYPDFSNTLAQLNYEDGTSAQHPITAEMIPDFDITDPGTQEVSLKYRGVTSEETLTIIVREKSISRISVKENPDKQSYHLYEELDLSGATISVIFDNGTTEEVIVTGEMVTSFDNSRSGRQRISLKYQGYQTYFYVDVYGVDSLTIASAPTDRVFVLGEPMGFADGQLLVCWLDGSSSIVNFADLNETNYTLEDSALGDHILSIIYGNKRTTLDITIIDRVISSIGFFTEPSKLQYILGEKIDPTGGVIKVFFQNGGNYYELVPLTFEMLSGHAMNQSGVQNITVTYEGFTTSFIIFVQNISTIENYQCNNDGSIVLTLHIDALSANNYIYFIAAYDDGRMRDVFITEIENDTLVCSFDNATLSDQFKIFVLSDTVTLCPVYPAQTLIIE